MSDAKPVKAPFESRNCSNIWNLPMEKRRCERYSLSDASGKSIIYAAQATRPFAVGALITRKPKWLRCMDMHMPILLMMSTKSIGGYTFKLANGVCSWSSRKKQTHSTTEAEYMALAHETQMALWM
ncbi:hypothetical protein JTB14_013018 [Gonioctena quinquepunctata]|nr:hypothetical protein JTB14_013018 [Gonioctena quinquepunctata]